MSDTSCAKCGLEITTGMMAAFCGHADQCEFWPHADRVRPETVSAELFMAKAWMHNTCNQIGLQIEDRERLKSRIARAIKYCEDETDGDSKFDSTLARIIAILEGKWI